MHRIEIFFILFSGGSLGLICCFLPNSALAVKY